MHDLTRREVSARIQELEEKDFSADEAEVRALWEQGWSREEMAEYLQLTASKVEELQERTSEKLQQGGIEG